MFHKRIPFVEQMQETECGLCCISMLLNYYGYHVALNELEEKYTVGRDGSSFKELGNILESYHYETVFYRIQFFPTSDLKTNEPMILYWDSNHFVVLEKKVHDTFYIIDPAYGRKRLCRSTFEKHFSNIALVVKQRTNSLIRSRKSDEWQTYKEFFKTNKLRVTATLVVALLYYGCMAIIPGFMGNVANSSVAHNITLLHSYLYLALIFLPIFVALYILRSFSVVHLSIKMDRFIYTRLISKIFNLPYSFFLNRNSSDILYKMSLTRANRDLLLDTVLQGLLDFGMVLVISGVFLLTNIKLFGLVSILTAIITILLLTLKNKIVLRNKNELLSMSKLQRVEYESLIAMFTIKGSGQEDYISKLILNQYSKSINAYSSRYKVNPELFMKLPRQHINN